MDSRGPHRDSHFEKTSESSSLLSWVLFNPLIYKSLSSQHFFPLTVTSSPSQGLTYHSILTCFHQFSEITLRSLETCQKTHLSELHVATDARVKWRGRLFSSSKSLSILQWFWVPTTKLYPTERYAINILPSDTYHWSHALPTVGREALSLSVRRGATKY